MPLRLLLSAKVTYPPTLLHVSPIRTEVFRHWGRNQAVTTRSRGVQLPAEGPNRMLQWRQAPTRKQIPIISPPTPPTAATKLSPECPFKSARCRLTIIRIPKIEKPRDRLTKLIVVHIFRSSRRCKVNDSVVRVGIIEGEYHWHKHDRDGEFFYVISGRLLIDLEERAIDLSPGQAFVVPGGVVHRTRAPERTIILMVENAGIIPTGDT